MSAWFSALGEALNPGEQETLRRYLRGLGVETRPLVIHTVSAWSWARELISDPAWDASLWQAEQAQRARLLQVVKLRSPAVLGDIGIEAISDKLHGAAAVAAARMGCADPGLIRAAAGAATEAVYLAQLARAANEVEHAFSHKLALFEGGHWPLVLQQNNYYIF